MESIPAQTSECFLLFHRAVTCYFSYCSNAHLSPMFLPPRSFGPYSYASVHGALLEGLREGARVESLLREAEKKDRAANGLVEG